MFHGLMSLPFWLVHKAHRKSCTCVCFAPGADETSGANSSNSSSEAKQLMGAICGRASGLATHMSVLVNTLFAMNSILDHQVRMEPSYWLKVDQQPICHLQHSRALGMVSSGATAYQHITSCVLMNACTEYRGAPQSFSSGKGGRDMPSVGKGRKGTLWADFKL
jgi:hypothetical protein